MKRLIGIGNPDRGDDAAGWLVADGVTTWTVDKRMAGSFDLIESWAADDEVVIVDAMQSGAEPGLVARFDATADALPASTFPSSHSFGPAEIVELARTMGRIPSSLTVIGIELGHTDLGRPMTDAVKSAVAQTITELQDA